jgi:hypothetical protein
MRYVVFVLALLISSSASAGSSQPDRIGRHLHATQSRMPI